MVLYLYNYKIFVDYQIFRGMEARANYDRHAKEGESVQTGEKTTEGSGYNEEEASEGTTDNAKKSLRCH